MILSKTENMAPGKATTELPENGDVVLRTYTKGDGSIVTVKEEYIEPVVIPKVDAPATVEGALTAEEIGILKLAAPIVARLAALI